MVEMTSSEAMHAIVVTLNSLIEDELLGRPEFVGISRENLRLHAIQQLREARWISSLNDVACNAARTGRSIWFQVGKGHAASLSCALRSLYGKSARVTTIEQGDVMPSIEAKLERFRTVEFPRIAKELKGVLKEMKGVPDGADLHLVEDGLGFWGHVESDPSLYDHEAWDRLRGQAKIETEKHSSAVRVPDDTLVSGSNIRFRMWIRSLEELVPGVSP